MACQTDADCGYGYVCVGGECVYGGRDNDEDNAGLSESQFLNTLDAEFAGYPLVNPSNAVDWTKLARTAVGALISLAFAGVFGLLQGIGDLIQLLYRGAGSFLGTLFGGFAQAGSDALARWVTETETAITSTFSGELAVLAFPVGVGVVMASLWIAARGIEEVR